MYFIIKGKSKFGKTRSEQEKNLRREGFGTTMTDEQLEKCRYLEKKLKGTVGSSENFLPVNDIDKVK